MTWFASPISLSNKHHLHMADVHSDTLIDVLQKNSYNYMTIYNMHRQNSKNLGVTIFLSEKTYWRPLITQPKNM